jgi:predicted dehydrogenase
LGISTVLAPAKVTVLWEKPLSESVDSAIRLRKECSKGRAVSALGMIERFNPAIREACEIIRGGKLGRILAINATREGPPPARNLGVGVGLDLATHDFDLIERLLDDQLSLRSITNRRIGKAQREDYFLSHGETEGGVVFSLNVNWRNSTKKRLIKVYGDEKVMWVDLISMQIQLGEIEGEVNEWSGPFGYTGERANSSQSLSLGTQEPLVAQVDQLLRFASTSERGDLGSLEDGERLLRYIQVS